MPLKGNEHLIQQVPVSFQLRHPHLGLYKSVFYDHNLVSQKQSLIYAVGHKQDAAPLFLPDPQKLFLHLFPGEIIQGSKRLVHHNEGPCSSYLCR